MVCHYTIMQSRHYNDDMRLIDRNVPAFFYVMTLSLRCAINPVGMENDHGNHTR